MRDISKVIVHCSATSPDQHIDVSTIDGWHRERGFDKIGYHFVILRTGLVENGRDEQEIGAHAKGHNTGSLGICLIGGIDDNGKPDSNFTMNQYVALHDLCNMLKTVHRLSTKDFIGHRDVSAKSCPCFSIQGFLEG